MSEVEFTSKASSLLLKMRAEHPHLVLLLDDTSCCSNSNVMARDNPPSWPVDLLTEKEGIKIYLNPSLRRSLRADRIIIDALDFIDDSLSLETNYGNRLITKTVSGFV